MSGLVTLLGAGPGDAELLTLKGKRRLQEADVLVFDRLVNQELFQHLKSDCEKIDVGKKPGQPCIRQEEIEKILIEKGHARTAKEYILYRAERTRIRNMNTKLMKMVILLLMHY